jgi:hypothetical protein
LKRDEVQVCTDRLIKEIQKLGYPRELGVLLARQLGTPQTIQKLTSYVKYNHPGSPEDIVDEMLAICQDRDIWRARKEAEYYNSKVTEIYNHFPKDE